MDIVGTLKEKTGPFPLYVWLLAMTAVGGVLLLLKKKKGKGAATGTPGSPCTQSDGSAGTWDSTGTVCQATTVSTVNTPTATGTTSGNSSGMRNWRAQSGGPTVTSGAGTTAATTTTSTTATVPPPATTVTTATPPT